MFNIYYYYYCFCEKNKGVGKWCIVAGFPPLYKGDVKYNFSIKPNNFFTIFFTPYGEFNA